MRRKLTVLIVVLLLAALAVPAVAITAGTRDVANTFPAVGQLLFFDPEFEDTRFDDPGAWFSCSGTLLSDTVLLTAGHCTFGVGTDGEFTEGDETTPEGFGGNDMWVSFLPESDFSILTPSDQFERHENPDRYDDWSAALDASLDWYRGTAIPHPEYSDPLFFLFDVGVVLFDEPIDASVHGDDFGVLPSEGYLNQFLTRRGSQQYFTPVGYGVLSLVPFFDGNEDDARHYAQVMLVDARGVYGLPPGVAVVFSNNRGQHRTGGTCFGDSGGPVFDRDTRIIVAVTSFGISPCIGNDGAFRIDTERALPFILAHLNGD